MPRFPIVYCAVGRGAIGRTNVGRGTLPLDFERDGPSRRAMSPRRLWMLGPFLVCWIYCPSCDGGGDDCDSWFFCLLYYSLLDIYCLYSLSLFTVVCSLFVTVCVAAAVGIFCFAFV